MFDIEYKEEDFIESINELVPMYQTSKILDVLRKEGLEESDYDQIGLSLTGEKQEAGLIVPAAAPATASKSMWGAIKSEVYDLLCTKSRKYSAERKEAGVTIKNLITIIATAIASSFNIAIGVVTGAVTIALMSALKIGKNAWCETNKPT